jgi:hypothetical protein
MVAVSACIQRRRIELLSRSVRAGSAMQRAEYFCNVPLQREGLFDVTLAFDSIFFVTKSMSVWSASW